MDSDESSADAVPAAASSAASGEPRPSSAHDQGSSGGRSHPRRHRGPFANLRKGYQVLRELLTSKPTTSRRSQLPYKSPRFADPLASWRLALDWLTRVTRRLRLAELPAPVFDRHGCFDRLEPRRLSPAAATTCEASGKKTKQQQQQILMMQQLRDRILRLAGSGDLLRALADQLLGDGDGGGGGGGSSGDSQGARAGRSQQQLPTPRQDLLQLPLSYETAAGHHHPSDQQSGHHHLSHLHLHLHHHQHPHLQPQAQASLNCCEENFAAFHRFLARVLTGPCADDGGACELRVALGKQCAECNAVCLLLRNHQHHLLLHHEIQQQQQQQQPQQPAPLGGGVIDCALSVLLLHLLTLMLLLDEPMSPKQRSEILLLWEHRLQPSALAESPSVREMRIRYGALMRR